MRKLSLVLLVLLLLAMVSVVAAQDVPCGDLSEEDCAFLSDSLAASASVGSATFTIDATLNTTNEDGDDTNIAISGDGAFSGAEGMLGGMMGGMMSDPAAAADMSGMMSGFESGVSAFDGALNLTIDTGDAPLDIQLVLVDSIGYINFGALGLAGMRMGQNAELPEWGGVNLVDLVSTVTEGMTPEQISSMAGNMAGGSAADASLASDLDFATVGSHIVLSRLEDSEIDGVAVAVYELSLDVAGWLNDPATMEMMQEQMANDPAAADMSAEDVTAMLAAAAENISFSVTGYFGLEDNYVYGLEIAASVDAAAIAEAAPDSANASGGGSFDLSFGIYFADQNAAPEITAPEGAVVAEADELMQMFGMMFMGAGSR
ncbi:MAG: hypothetical protein U0694_13445 [Anaerolineae bacterium]